MFVRDIARRIYCSRPAVTGATVGVALTLVLVTGVFAQTLGVFGDAACTQTTITVPTNTPFSVWVAMQGVVLPAKGVAWSLNLPGLGTAYVHVGTAFLGATLGSFEDEPGPHEYYWFTDTCPAGATGHFLLARLDFVGLKNATVNMTPAQNSFEAPNTYLTCSCVEVPKQQVPVQFQGLEVVIGTGGALPVPGLGIWGMVLAALGLSTVGVVLLRRHHPEAVG
jgi:hypothetical protein